MSYIGHTHGCGSQDDIATNKYAIEEKFNDFTAEKFKFYSINSMNNVVNVTLPSGSLIQNGEWIGFIDNIGSFGTNSLIIKYNGSDKIRNNADDLVVDLNYINFKLVFNNGNWNVLDMSITSVTNSEDGGGSSSPRYNLINVNSNFSALPLTLYAVNTTSNIITVTLPTTVQNGDWIDFVDNAGKFGINKLIIAYNNIHTIRGNPDNLEVDLNFINFRMLFNNGNWTILDMSMSNLIIGDSGGTSTTLNIDQLNQALTYVQANDKYTVVDTSGIINAVKGTYYLVDTSSYSATVNLPSNPSNGDWIIISDKNKTFGIHIVLVRFVAPRAIAGNLDNFNLDVNGAKVKLVYYNNNWDVLSL